MYTFITLKCNHCGSVIFNLPEDEANKLNGLTFLCECCNTLTQVVVYDSERISA